MFEKDQTGILKGYYERMHPSVQAILGCVRDPSAEIVAEDMDLVWRGWATRELMEAVFGVRYKPEYRPKHGSSYANGAVGDLLYRGWKFYINTDLTLSDVLDFEGFVEILGAAVGPLKRWGEVVEGMIYLKERDGAVHITVAIRGWRCHEEEGLHI